MNWWKGRAAPATRQHRSPALWWPLAVGVVLVLVAIAIEHSQWTLDHRTPSHIFTPEVAILLIAELGYAFVIAWVVSIAIEAGARREHQRAVEEAQTLITQNVFEALYGLRHEPRYVRTVIEKVLEACLIREFYEVTYRIDPYPQPPEEGVDPTRFVLLSLQARYVVRNVSTRAEHFHLKFALPLRQGPLRHHTRLTALHLAGEARSEDEIDALEIAMPEAPDQRTYRIDMDLESQASREVLLNARMVKELSDSETFGFLQPTMRMTVRLQVNVPGLVFGMRARTATPASTTFISPDGRSGEWTIDGPILPYNSIALWWRSLEDDGQVATEPENRQSVNLIAPESGVNAR